MQKIGNKTSEIHTTTTQNKHNLLFGDILAETIQYVIDLYSTHIT